MGRETRARLPAGLIGAAVLVAAAEAAVFAPFDAPASFIAASWRASARAAGEGGEAARLGAGSVLCFGDSQVKAGLLPGVLTRRLGRPAYNLAVVGGQPAAGLALFERVLRAGARPAAVVVGYYPGLLAASPRINSGLWPEVLGVWGCLDLSCRVRDPELAGPMLARAALPSLRRREGVRAAVAAALRGAPDAGSAEARAYLRNWRVNAGAHALPSGRAYADDPRPAAGGGRWRPRAENALDVRRFLALASRRGVPVFWLLPTNAPGLAAARARDGRGAAYDRFLAGLQRAYPGLTVIDPSPVLGDPRAFSDACHLDRDGAVGLSLAVAEALAPALSGGPPGPAPGRRVALAALGAAGPRWAALEDVDQSAAVVRAGAGPAAVAVAPREGAVRR